MKITLTNDTMMKRRIVKIEEEDYLALGMITPFTEIEILIKAEDMKISGDVIDWLYHKCGIITPREYLSAIKSFEKKRSELAEMY